MITLPKEVTKEVTPAKTVTVTTLTIVRMVDLPQEKIVRAFIREVSEPVTLWEKDAYDNAGQWTDADVEKRLIEIFS